MVFLLTLNLWEETQQLKIISHLETTLRVRRKVLMMLTLNKCLVRTLTNFWKIQNGILNHKTNKVKVQGVLVTVLSMLKNWKLWKKYIWNEWKADLMLKHRLWTNQINQVVLHLIWEIVEEQDVKTLRDQIGKPLLP